MYRISLSSLKRLTLAGMLAVLNSGALAVSGAVAEQATAPPAFVHQALDGAALSGRGQLRFFGLRIYDAQLWVGTQFKASDFDAYPMALELTYYRAFTGAAIAQRSVEEIEREGELTPELALRWQNALAAVLPDVEPGDRLTGVYEPGLGMRLWRGDLALGMIEDAELARRFFGIWLGPNTSEPSLRRALLARESGS